MKKVLLLIVAVMFATTSFAQDWSVGARVGSGLQAVAQYDYNSSSYLEGRFGASWLNHDGFITADFTLLHNWKIAEMDWTPRGGIWFFDAGVGVNVGGRENYAYVGIAGMARLGFTFNNTPVTLSLDYTPVIGPEIAYWEGHSAAEFKGLGFGNVGITATYNF